MADKIGIEYRSNVLPDDVRLVGDIVESTGFFNEEEIGIAKELVQENLAKGAKVSGYHFIFAKTEGRDVAYSCFGPIAGTQESYDLFWIAVHESMRGKGIGKRLMVKSEEAIASMGGHRVYVETSSRDQYVPTRQFYLNNGYKTETILKDFYAPGDGKVIMVKVV